MQTVLQKAMPLLTYEQRLFINMEALLVLAALILAVGPLPASSLCQGNTLPTLFPNVNWQECLTQTFQENATCLGNGISGTSCENIEQTAECQTDGTWGLVYGGCRGCGTAPDVTALPSNARWACAPGPTTPVPLNGVCSAVCIAGFTGSGATTATCDQLENYVWQPATGNLQCTPFTLNLGCGSSARPTLPTGAAYSCPPEVGDYTCTTVCTTGYTAANSSRLNVTCSNGVWAPSIGSITCNPADCNSSALPSLPPNATWLCGSASPSDSTCISGCADGYTAASTDRVTVTCSLGQWISQSGTITCLPASCNNTALPALPANAVWNCSESTPSDSTCTSSCASGYLPSSTATALCSLGNWTDITGAASCSLPGTCTGNPSASLIVNATWNCPPTTPNAANCTGACNGGDAGSNPPVAQCGNGTWTYLAGACQPGSKVRYLTIEAPNDFSADFMKYFKEGKAVEWINAHIEETKAGYKYFIPAILWPYVESQLGISNAWTTDSAKFVSSNRRKLLQEQGKQAITIGFQLRGSNKGGVLPAFMDIAIDNLLQSRVVLVGLTGFIVRQAELLQEPYPGYDYSTVAIGFSDPAGVIETPVTPVDCNLFLDANISSYSPENFRQNLPAAVAQKLLGNRASVCKGATEIQATFPVVAPHPENIASAVVFSAVVKRPGSKPVDVPGFACQVTPGSVPGSQTNYSSQYTVDVTCKKSDGSRLNIRKSYLIVLLGSFTCNEANLTSSAAFQVDVAAGPQLTARIVQQPASVCSSDQEATADFNYTLSAAAGSAVTGQWDVQGTAVTRNTNAKCTVKVTQSSSITGRATVSCTGNFTAVNNIQVQLTLSATQGSCSSRGGMASTSIPVVCCATGASYARQTTGGSGSTPCIGHITPGTPARGCTANTASKGYINNQGPGQATLYYTASNQQCPGKIGVASITVACADQNTLAFTLMSAARRGGGNTRFVYVSCSRVPLDQTCPGVKWLRIGGQQAPATSTVGAGGAQIVNFNATIASGAGCTCSTAYWAVYTAGTFNGLPRSVCTV